MTTICGTCHNAAPADIVILTIKVLPATNTKGTRMKISHGMKPKTVTYGYHSVNSFADAATRYMATVYNVQSQPILTNWTETSRQTVSIALVY